VFCVWSAKANSAPLKTCLTKGTVKSLHLHGGVAYMKVENEKEDLQEIWSCNLKKLLGPLTASGMDFTKVWYFCWACFCSRCCRLVAIFSAVQVAVVVVFCLKLIFSNLTTKQTQLHQNYYNTTLQHTQMSKQRAIASVNGLCCGCCCFKMSTHRNRCTNTCINIVFRQLARK